MAAIDKLYMTRTEALAFTEYAKQENVDRDFYNFFNQSAHLIEFLWTFKLDEDYWKNDPAESLSFTCFPEVIDTWLLQRKDLPDWLRKLMYDHYYNNDQKTIDEILAKDLTKTYKKTKKCKVMFYDSRCHKCHGWFENYNCTNLLYIYGTNLWIDISGTNITDSDYWWYNSESDHWSCNTYPDLNLSGNHSSCCSIKINSKKALIRKILKWGLPTGTEIKVTNRLGLVMKVVMK